MKQLSVLFAAVLLFFATGTVSAQKIATLDVESVLNAMPEKKAADEKLNALQKVKESEIKKQADDLQALVQKYQGEASKQTEAVNQQREQEVQKKQSDIQQMVQLAQKDMADKSSVEYAPIEKKFNEAVTAVAKAKGYDYIFDSASTALIYKGGPDATADVKKQLGL